MIGSAIYGAILGVAFTALRASMPHAVAEGIWWALLGAQLTFGAVVTWRRTALPFASAAMGIGAAGSLVLLSAALNGQELGTVVRTWPISMGILAASGPLCFLIESRAHRAQWLQWKRHMQDATPLDIFLARHIPDLRGEGAEAPGLSRH